MLPAQVHVFLPNKLSCTSETWTNSTPNNLFSNGKRNFETTNLTVLSSRANNAWLAISVFANSAVGRKRIRATSSATLPWKYTYCTWMPIQMWVAKGYGQCQTYHYPENTHIVHECRVQKSPSEWILNYVIQTTKYFIRETTKLGFIQLQFSTPQVSPAYPSSRNWKAFPAVKPPQNLLAWDKGISLPLSQFDKEDNIHRTHDAIIIVKRGFVGYSPCIFFLIIGYHLSIICY